MNSVFMLSESIESNEPSKISCCIIVYMFYEDLLNQCYLYIEQIPEYIDVWLVTSNPKIALKVKKYISKTNKKNYKVLVKENRGRDINTAYLRNAFYRENDTQDRLRARSGAAWS